MRKSLVIVLFISMITIITVPSKAENTGVSSVLYHVNGQPPLIWGVSWRGDTVYWAFKDNSSVVIVQMEPSGAIEPLFSYEVTVSGYDTRYYFGEPHVMPFNNSFLIWGNLRSEIYNPFKVDYMSGFWIANVSRSGKVNWARAYLTKLSSSILRAVRVNDGILIIGDGSIYSGGDAFIALLNSKTGEIEKGYAFGGRFMDGISRIIKMENGNLLLVGTSWSFGAPQTALFLIEITPQLDIVQKRAYITYENWTPVKGLELDIPKVKVLEDGNVVLEGTFRVWSYTPNTTVQSKEGLWELKLDRNLNVVSYSFRELASPTTNLTLSHSYLAEHGGRRYLIEMMYTNHFGVFVGEIKRDIIDGETIGIPTNTDPTRPQIWLMDVAPLEDSMMLFLNVHEFADERYASQTEGTLVIKVPYDNITAIRELKKRHMYSGSFRFELKKWDVDVRQYHGDFDEIIHTLKFNPPEGTIKLTQKTEGIPQITTIRDPGPSGKLEFPDIANETHVYIDGKYVGAGPKMYTLPAGVHMIRFQHEGFIPYTCEVEIKPDHVHYVFGPAYVTITTTPPNSTIVLMEQDKNISLSGKSPLKAILRGSYTLKVTKEGFRTVVKDIHVFYGKNVTLHITLPPQSATLKIESDPSALVFINGTFKGNTPLEVELPPGQYAVELKKDGYQNYSITVALKDRDVVTIGEVLEKVPTTTTKSPEVLENATSTTSSPAQKFFEGNETEDNPGAKTEKSICGPGMAVIIALLSAGIRKRHKSRDYQGSMAR
ncbi:hypothetical protein CL1_0690 [Thermococcus cleftensis]|uniref:PEGA domain-containing protein n=1 Tax=Thermococcus cleftensis (strain DSM 27260 / KACC 17922 / CL1) TaxID=163003 RepID=I3ZT61_THECF|nr:PEGA domain-containing protein [Thermococcus cleftensis]AFL94895.1 hypothetical protein CL1_0690 [Thermococcus cleftensis]